MRRDVERIKAAPPSSFADFIATFWHLLEIGTPYQHNWHIDVICQHLDAVERGEIKRLIINIPPGFMKSLLCNVFWPAWVWTRMPESRWMFTSHNISLSIRDSVKMRRLIQSPEYQALYPFVRLTSDQNAKERYETDKTGYRLVVPLTSATGERCRFLVMDDPNNVLEVESQAHRDEVNGAWDGSFAMRGSNPDEFAAVIIQQRCHEEDLTGHLINKDAAAWVVLSLPAEFEEDHRCITPIGVADNRHYNGELLWPDRYDQKWLADAKKNLGSHKAAGQLQQRPAPMGGGVLKRHWFRFWVPAGMEGIYPPVRVRQPDGTDRICKVEPLPSNLTAHAQSWDLNFGSGEDPAFVVGQVWAKAGARRYLLDQVRGQWSFVETVKAIRELSALWPQALRKIVENKANGPAVLSMLEKEISGLIAWNPPGTLGAKESRVSAISPTIEAGDIWLPHPAIAPWVENYLTELTSFPKTKYKDQVDSTTQMLLVYLEGTGTWSSYI